MGSHPLSKFSHCYESCFASRIDATLHFMPFGAVGSAYLVPSEADEKRLVRGVVTFCLTSVPILLGLALALFANRMFDSPLTPWLAIAGFALAIWIVAYLVWVRVSCTTLTRVPQS